VRRKFRRRSPNRSIGGDIGMYLFLALLCIMMAVPMVYAVTSSLKPLDELFKFPPTLFARNPTFDNFSDLFVTMSQSYVPFSRYVFNTVFVTFAGTAGEVIIASMAAYVLAKYNFPGGRIFFNVVVTALMFTGYVTAIPNYLIMTKLHIVDTYWALILPAFAAPIGLFLMKQYMEGIPDSIIEAAKIDGANEWTTFIKLVMPNAKPAWLTIIIFSVQSLWNNNASNLIYTENLKPVTYALQQIQLGGIVRTGQTAAVTVIIMLLPVLIFIFAQSQVLETMATSGLKD
jgi:ABC-type glycerol-3-phosphate transport system permease component